MRLIPQGSDVSFKDVCEVCFRLKNSFVSYFAEALTLMLQKLTLPLPAQATYSGRDSFSLALA
jgi:hypothetical protein